jgi:hypothetical protein
MSPFSITDGRFFKLFEIPDRGTESNLLQMPTLLGFLRHEGTQE